MDFRAPRGPPDFPGLGPGDRENPTGRSGNRHGEMLWIAILNPSMEGFMEGSGREARG